MYAIKLKTRSRVAGLSAAWRRIRCLISKISASALRTAKASEDAPGFMTHAGLRTVMIRGMRVPFGQPSERSFNRGTGIVIVLRQSLAFG